MLNQRKDDVVSRVRAWCCVYVRFAGKLQLLQELFDLCSKHEKEAESRTDDITVCKDLWLYSDIVETRLAQMECKL